MKRQILIVSILLVAVQLFGQETRFWVGGSGKWADNSHWSTVSGGEPGASVPESGTSVVFDANSFSGDKNTVTLKDAVVIGSLTATDAEFVFSGKKSLTVEGSVSVDSKADFGKLRGALVLSAAGDQTLELPTKLEGNIIIEGGNWNLASDLATDGDIIINAGSLNSNNYGISCNNFTTNSSNLVKVDLGTSAVVVKSKWVAVLNNSNSVFDASNADITMVSGFNKTVRTVGNVKYGNLHRDNVAKNVTLTSHDEKPVSCNVEGLHVDDPDEDPNDDPLVNDGSTIISVSGATNTYSLIVYGHDENGFLVANNDKSVRNIPKDQTEVPITDLSVGDYTVDFVSSEGSATGVFFITAPPKLDVKIEVKDSAKCYHGPIVQLKATTVGGNGDYKWTWKKEFTAGDYSVTQYAENFPYDAAISVIAEDKLGCKTKNTFNYYDESDPDNSYHNQPKQFISSGVAANTCAGEATGSITVSVVQGGRSPFTYAVEKNGTQYGGTNENTIGNLSQGTYSIIVTDDNGCIASANTVLVQSSPAPIATLTGDDENCEGDVNGFALTGVAQNSTGVSWIKLGTGSWGTESTSGDNTTRNSSNVYHPSTTEENAGSAQVVFLAQPLEGCTAKGDTMTLKINAIPEPKILTKNDTVICGYTFTIRTNPATGDFEWLQAGSNPSKAKFAGNTVTVEKDGSYVFTLKQKVGECEGNSDEFKISFYAEPDVEINKTNTTVCNNDTLTLTAKIDNVKSFEWSCPVAAGTIPDSDKKLKTPRFIPKSGFTGTATITLTYEANGSCDDNFETVDITVNPAPAPSFITADDDLCGDEKEVQVSIATGSSVEWIKGSGDKSKVTIENDKSATAKIKVTDTGTYGFYAIETAANGCSAKTEKELKIAFTMPPTVKIVSVSDTEICGDGISAITATSNVNVINWETNGEAGTCSPVKGKTTVYSPSESDQGKSIKVYAMVSGSGVCAGKSAKDSATVIVNRVPNPKLTAPAAVCGDSARVKITDGIAGSVKSFTKASGAGNISFLNITDTTIDVKVSKAGEYKFNFTETNGDCSNQTPVTVTIRFDEKLKLKLTSLEDDTFMCSTGSNGEYQLKANAPGCDKTSISWSISSGLGEFDPKFGEIVSFKPTLLANEDKHEYKIMATGTPLASVCPAPYDSISIVVYRKPTPTFAGGESCGLSKEFTATKSMTSSQGFWSSEDNNPNISIEVDANDDSKAVITDISGEGGTYSIVFTEKNGECSASDTADVVFIPDPVAYAGNDTVICYEAELKISELAYTLNSDNLLWKTSGTGKFADNKNTILQPTYIPSEADKAAGQVTLSLIAFSSTCLKSDTSEIVVTINPEFTVGIGSVSPFDISASTKIEVSLWLKHQNFAYLSYHLMAPDGTTVKLYDHYNDVGTGSSSMRNKEMNGLTFTTESSEVLNLGKQTPPFVGQFKVSDANGWSNIFGKDPAEGGWSVIVKSEFGDVVGTLYRTTISFTDVNRKGELQTVMFDSKDINTFIVANPRRVKYIVPMGLYTRCFDSEDAHAIVNPMGGSGIYNEFVWNDPEKTGSDVYLGAGDWTVTVTDAVGCQATGAVTVYSPDTIKIATSVQDIECFGSKTGSASVEVTAGGVGNISYNWTSDESEGKTISTANTITGVGKDTYYVYAIDQNECHSKVDTLAIFAPDSINAELVITAATSCDEEVANGQVKFTITEGNGAPYNVELLSSDIDLPLMQIMPNDAKDEFVVSGLGASEKLEFRIYDVKGCSIDTTISTVPENSITIEKVVVDDNKCATKDEGSISVEDISYGSGDYSYKWFNNGVEIEGMTSSVCTGLAAGKYYSVTVTDNITKCPATFDNIEVRDPDTIKFAAPVFTDSIKCLGDENASFSVAVIGGTGALSYEWQGIEGGNTNSLSNVGAGEYKLIVTDANQCKDSTTVTVESPTSILELAVEQLSEADCGVDNASVKAEATGGVENNVFTYQWISLADPTIVKVGAERSDIGAGQYRIVAKDKFGCEVYDTLSVKDNGKVDFELSVVRSVSCLTREDAIVKVSNVTDKDGAVGSYIVKWSDNDSINAPDSMLRNLGAQTYVTVQTENKCFGGKLVEAVGDSTLHFVTPIVNMPDVSGKGNGWLKVVVAGGIGDKNYTWTVETEGNAINDEDVANVVDTTTLKNRMEGEYHIHVEDMLGGCGIDTTLKVEYRPVGFDYVVNDVACQGTNSGSVTITGKGGYDKTQYEYMWVRLDADLAPIDTNYYHGRTIDIADLYAASYRCVVWQIDTSLVLPHDDTIVVKEPSNRLHIYNDSILVDGSNCYEAKGSISIMQPADSAAAYDYFGGYLPFTYYIDGEEITGSDIRKTNLKPDTYKVYIEDAKGCKFDTLVAVNDISAFKDSIYVSNVLRCNGDDNGEITVEVSSNNGNNFKFQWEKKTDDGALTLKDTTAVIGDLTAGTYMVKVTDDSLCVKFDTIKLSQPLPITFSVSNTIVNTCYTTNDGEIQIVSLKGGSEIPNLKYKAFKFENIAKEKTIYDNGKFVNALTVNTLVDTAFVLSEQLKPADYTVVVFDEGGCFSEPYKFTVPSMYPQIVVDTIKDLVVPECYSYDKNGNLSYGKIEVKVSTAGQSQVSTSLVKFYQFDGSDATEASTFDKVTAGEHEVIIGFTADMYCADTVLHTLGSRNNLKADARFNSGAKSIFTCPDKELTAYVTAHQPFNYKFYTLTDEDAEKMEIIKPAPAPAKEQTVVPVDDSTTTVDTSDIAIRFNRGIYFRADSLSADSTVVDTLAADSVPTIELPTYDHATIRGRSVTMFAEGSSTGKNDAWVDDFRPYGTETFYYFEINDNVCISIDSIKATSLRPVDKLHAIVAMDDATPEDLMVGTMYEVPEGGELILSANQLEFEFSDNIFAYAENGWLWQAAPLDNDGGTGLSIANTTSTSWNENPLVAQGYGMFAAKVWDSVRFELSDDTEGVYRISDTILTCSYYDTVLINAKSSIKPMQVFTPNGDEYNQYWEIDGLASYDKATIYVFNRWGGRVWQYSGTGKEYAAKKWDGRNEKNKPVPSGTYYYVIQCTDGVLGGKKVTGPVTIIR